MTRTARLDISANWGRLPPGETVTGRAKREEIPAEVSTLSSTDVAAAIEAFLSIVPNELADGNVVSLGDFGSFRLRTHGEGADTPEEVTARRTSHDRFRRCRPPFPHHPAHPLRPGPSSTLQS